MELILSNTGTHGAGTRHTTLDHLQQLINVIGSRPLLVLNNIDTSLHLWLLDKLAVSSHASGAVLLGELIGDKGGGVETSKGDELPAVSEGSKSLDVSLLIILLHSSLPVEGWRQVVSQLLLWVDGVDTLGESLGLGEIWELRLHPDGVSVWSVGKSTVDTALDSTLHSVVTLTGTWVVPVPEDLLSDDTASDGAGLWVRLALDIGLELLDDGLGVWNVGGLDLLDGSLGEGAETGVLGPLVLNGLESVSGLSGIETGNEELVQWLELWIGGTEDEWVVAWVNGGGDESGGLSIGTGDGEEVGAHDISLCTDGNKSVDVL